MGLTSLSTEELSLKSLTEREVKAALNRVFVQHLGSSVRASTCLAQKFQQSAMLPASIKVSKIIICLQDLLKHSRCLRVVI